MSIYITSKSIILSFTKIVHNRVHGMTIEWLFLWILLCVFLGWIIQKNASKLVGFISNMTRSSLKWLIEVDWSGLKWSEVVWSGLNISANKNRCHKSRFANGFINNSTSVSINISETQFCHTNSSRRIFWCVCQLLVGRIKAEFM